MGPNLPVAQTLLARDDAAAVDDDDDAVGCGCGCDCGRDDDDDGDDDAQSSLLGPTRGRLLFVDAALDDDNS